MHAMQRYLTQHFPTSPRHGTLRKTRVPAPALDTCLRLVILLDRYIDAMLHFLAVNVAHSILHRATSPPTPPEIQT
jgi:hypothetical protein